MVINRLVNRRMKLVETEAQLYILTERRIALINQINILEEIQQEEKARIDKEEELKRKKDNKDVETDTGRADSSP